MNNTNETIIVEQTFNVSLSILWNAITNIEDMRKWFFENIKDFKPEIGFKTQFNVQSNDRNFLHLWHIVEVEPLKRIVYNWKYDKYAGNSFVYFELFEHKKGSMLRVTTEITESFATDIPEFESDSCRNGWNYFIKSNLKNYLKK
ncbi:MAG: ATPase [Lutibacter sp.]|nr:MAG: ATPase [Lutibacter sp.]PHS52746.1 MAG: ATPase [Lutibacter sp.]